jgi:Double zinc ribbon
VSDVESFFRHLVRTLAATDPARLRRPIPLAEVHQSIVPYRKHRRALGVDSSEEYETLLLRLCAGEGDLVRTEPGEVGERFAREAASPHPELDVLHQQAEVTITLARDAVMRALEHVPDPPAAPEPPAASEPPVAPEPPEPPPESPFEFPAEWLAEAEPAPEEAAEPEPAAAASCGICGGDLPKGRTVNFCPHCGRSLTTPRCQHCGGELEPGWRYCVSCGASVRSA